MLGATLEFLTPDHIVEIVVLPVRRLTTNHLYISFDIGPLRANKDNNVLALDNLLYGGH